MNRYEMLYIIDNSIEDESKEQVMQRIKGVIETAGGNILEENKWGTTKFAYPINHQREGYYVVLDFEADPTLPEELNRQIRNINETYRCMIIKK